MLKADLHLHAKEDSVHKLKYTSYDLIDRASELGFKVLAFTFHRELFFNKDIESYARKKGILLIPGVEAVIEGKEVLLYNVPKKDVKGLKTFEDLKKLKAKKEILVIAPHPFFHRHNCLAEKLLEHIDLFDGIEYSHFYIPFLNLNKRAVRVAEKHGLPLIGNSDAHQLRQLNWTYTLVDSKKTKNDLIRALKRGKTKLKTRPVSIEYFITRSFRVLLGLE